jgi:hypothetical protein
LADQSGKASGTWRTYCGILSKNMRREKEQRR